MNLKLFGNIVSLIPAIISAVQAVESFSKGKGKQKQDEAVSLVGAFLALAEGAVGKDILNDEEVAKAVRVTIDAVVALENVIRDARAKKSS
jgi:hypothetical protein